MEHEATDWSVIREREMAKPYWRTLQDFVNAQRAEAEVSPPTEDVFAALDLTPLGEVKVVILGRDPYHGPCQAHGLSFSVRKGIPPPSSLRNILGELESDLGIGQPTHGDLTHWAEQGVLLLNTILTVDAGHPKSHARRGWETFTDEVIRAVSDRTDPAVFMLWGNRARRKRPLIAEHHHVIESSHPSGLSARRTSRPFISSSPFSRANAFLGSTREIDWAIPE
ncbi:uracil-DNA glycosylase [Ornithinimicrobium sp. F0845]|uniref:uracil-DNA glycosylase n=1 Tax=Ornithinimicrobium sp. F0845 TaxID=2926412 RepID=UPI001FF49D5B|nr:uracil-DNA glycosylase [Ornithinimicrobium sp. F0845]MCK0112674.1 uracil-DNA glycosylase [Ornithinimicrobium sp. F0845]